MALDQHGFELHWFTYKQITFFNKYILQLHDLRLGEFEMWNHG